MEGKQNALKSNLADSDMLFEFLMGNVGYFDSQLAVDNPLLKSIIAFETGFRILTNLNFEYHFEEIRKPSTPILEEIIPIPKEKPMLSDQDAVEYFLANVFNK
ncbi:hypothetical protein H4O18_16395 [Arenibacter sp. BSSL-BM3]|uniref:Uncharacterized protein n=1 Tax=Arenibacter arenosicollis TaxID=2762274 RepID=A0ABR7QQV9_9FLAO|nr:hypothetical protein [Arenibacter arenosicollis]MBC8769580.1 hypothetical protein [Arenibacter arenosicollis]